MTINKDSFLDKTYTFALVQRYFYLKLLLVKMSDKLLNHCFLK